MISIKMRGAEELNAFFKSLPRGTMKEAISAFTTYIIGDEHHGLRYYPPRVHHNKNNPYKWQTEKQRRAYFASNGFGGGIPSTRTDKLRNGWTASKDPYRKTIFNELPYAKYVMGGRPQKGHKADGWRTVRRVLRDNIVGGMKAATQAVARWIKAKGK
jgi:hypothetical protein